MNGRSNLFRFVYFSLVIVLFAAGEHVFAQGLRKTLRETGNTGVRINIVILAEGYTAVQQAKFDSDAVVALNAMLADPFYAGYNRFFNAYSIFVASAQSGADHPSTHTYVNTYFNSTFGSFGVDRSLTIPPNDIDSNYADGQGKVVNLLSQLLPDYDIALVIVNDATYGGSGGQIAVASTNPSSTEIAIHELGHTITHLGDEYADPFPGYPDTEEPNTTRQTIPGLVKWRGWFVPGTPYPTPQTAQYASIVGLFEGAHYHATGWYRPQLNCKMRALNTPFCEVCLEAGALSFYNLSPPIDSSIPASTSLSLTRPQVQNFALSVKQPSTPLSIRWALDGRTLAFPTGTSLALNTSTLAPGPHIVDVLAQDVSGRIRTDPLGLSQDTRTWRIDLNGPTPLSQPMNISTRGNVQGGENVMIGGFIISGTAPKKLIIRALGPSLQRYGVAAALSDPVLELRGAGGALIGSNNNWRDAQAAQITATGYQPQDDREAAILATLPVGSYTAIVRGNNTTGTALIEVYDLESGASSRLGNISTRGLVQLADNVMIGGFILGNQRGGSRVVVRAIGPSLSAYGISGALQDPALDFYNSNGGRLGSDNNWKDTQQVAIQAAGLAPKDAREAAIMAVLPPGAYTAVVRGSTGGTGVALVEVYDLR